MHGRSGILLIDKPTGPTSHDLVSRTRRALGTRKIGHAGTLDPLASGLLVLGANSSTRLLTFLVGLDKTYEATIRLGHGTTTDDAEGEALAPGERRPGSIADGELEAAIRRLTGAIEQVPSSVSAIKVDGRRAYDRARAGEEVTLAARPVTITEFALLERRDGDDTVDLDVRVTCSSGTYIRALARDLGADLGSGGHLTALRRTRVGPFSIEQAVAPDDIGPDALLPPARAASLVMPTVSLDEAQARDLAQGKKIASETPAGGPLAAVGPGERLVGIVESNGDRLRPVANFPSDEVLP